MRSQPPPRRELGHDARAQQHQADGKGAQRPANLHAPLEHEPVEQGQHQDEDRRLSEERRAAMCGDGDEVDESGGSLLARTVAACGEQDKTRPVYG